MADAKSRVQIFLKSPDGPVPVGWSETFYSADTDLTVAANRAMNIYVPKRAQLLGIGAQVYAVRTTNVVPNRLSYLRFVSDADGKSEIFKTPEKDDTDPTQVDLLLRMMDSTNHRRQFWLGGLPDSTTDQLKAQGMDAPFLRSPAYKQWVACIATLQWAIRYRIPPTSPKTYDSGVISNVLPIMIRNRKRGRPFFLYRGRRGV